MLFLLQKEYVLFEQVQRYCYVCDNESVYREMVAEGSFEESSCLKLLLQSTMTQGGIFHCCYYYILHLNII